MIRAYVAPTEHPAIWVEVPAGRVDYSSLRATVFVELTPDEAEDLREQLHHATRTAELECETPTCKTHQVGGGYCAEHGGRP